MIKHAKDIKVNDIIWVINEGDKPQLLPLIVTNIDIKKMLWTRYYNLTVKLPDGSDKYISLFDTGDLRDYNVSILTDLIASFNYNNYDELKESSINIMMCFDKDALWKQYVDGLEKSIKSVEEVIEHGKQNLKVLNKKLKYIKKQHDNIQKG